jgi:hypothetical protein
MSSQPRYRGPINTVEHAFMAGIILNIRCQRCCRRRSEWAYLLCLRKPKAKTLRLGQAVSGFYCHGCKHSVNVYISARREASFKANKRAEACL